MFGIAGGIAQQIEQAALEGLRAHFNAFTAIMFDQKVVSRALHIELKLIKELLDFDNVGFL